ncbi:hypothetical protein LTR50_006118 [Elasticomyces elasticus]|nr:hypothetical protein LTR50_006118 [Elasticomyces elasticus]
MPSLSSFADPRTYHVLSYGTLLGSTIFQSFIGGVVAFKALPRPQFSTLQQAIFPIFFSMQTALPVVLALTYPGEKAAGIGSLLRTNEGFGGLLAEQNRWSVMVPVATMFATSLANLVAVGPATTRVMRERKHQETRDGKKSYDAAPHSKEMQRLNRSFSRLHGASSLLNVAGLLAMMWYGVTLSERL